MRLYDARAWLIWLLAGGLLAITAGNPLYLILLLVISRLVQYACAPLASPGWRLPFWRIAVMILLFSTIFNFLTAHFGETVLHTLPAGWPLIGGPLTFEAAVYGFINGLRLVTMLSFFLAFNTIVPVSDLAGLTPRALHELGLVMLIAITYIPETIRQFRRIRDAQAIRGHQLNGLRAWRPVLIPLLIAGLERALNLAETMVARGYGSTDHVGMPRRVRVALLFGLLLILGGGLRLAWRGVDGWLLLFAGLLVVAFSYYHLSRRVVRTRYRPRKWTVEDAFVILGALISLLPLLPWPGQELTGLAYTPYPRLHPPPFALLVGLAILGLAAPAIPILFGRPELENAI